MSPQTQLAHDVEALFQQHWRRRVHGTPDGPATSLQVVDPASLDRLLKDLVAILDQAHDRPAHELTPTIRLLIIEHDFVDDGGDAMLGLSLQTRVDEWVSFFVDLLEDLRLREIGQGQWCEHPAAIPMFG